ncbi:hypothetical protein TOPH_06168 [Tolypocladium ophioglossoides CBS 100239]|uniref:Uncharacterized protein n=1 Tax=Tolypocladium ophioglossoides (strain CBS 100239) TaxID=1163406 RepID=A0A0L0N585_TOLOC|nr:hypothetical protein TOPH_06168 [Tolypocladium ophioglossoides CBS 100239]
MTNNNRTPSSPDRNNPADGSRGKECKPSSRTESTGEDITNRTGGDQENTSIDESGVKPGKVDFEEIFARVEKENKEMDKEQLQAKYPWMKRSPPRPVNSSVAMAAVEELFDGSDREND